ncbi:hypothetical protein BKA67DRAFT_647325 [Truncatella angustata]|uniref:Uncharacterized protein n=1 Tax=Truncatella angustata TaxID=152316 RepID=A0A9P8ZWV3_9PEZI|nr:uncharacterized protein BKA67DRAFT_647325 [Truncatella angustata]KAH6653431.1 hypothetical protein BKA67DRAFT_647325 [Truncatella angustata]
MDHISIVSFYLVVVMLLVMILGEDEERTTFCLDDVASDIATRYFSDGSQLRQIFECDCDAGSEIVSDCQFVAKTDDLVRESFEMPPNFAFIECHDARRGQFLVYTVTSRMLLHQVEIFDRMSINRSGEALPFIIIAPNGHAIEIEDCISEEDVRSLAERIKDTRAEVYGISRSAGSKKHRAQDACPYQTLPMKPREAKCWKCKVADEDISLSFLRLSLSTKSATLWCSKSPSVSLSFSALITDGSLDLKMHMYLHFHPVINGIVVYEHTENIRLLAKGFGLTLKRWATSAHLDSLRPGMHVQNWLAQVDIGTTFGKAKSEHEFRTS